MKKAIAIGIAGAALLASVLPVLGHGMGAGPQAVDPEAPNCMGLLTSKHAIKYKGVAHTNHVLLHNEPHGPALKTFETVKDQMHAFQDYCGLHMDEE